MADDKKPAGQPPRANRGRRRPPPTIDLKATEVASAAPEAKPEPAEAAAPPPEPPRAPAPEPAPELPPIPKATPHAPDLHVSGDAPPPPPVPPSLSMLAAAAGGGAAIAAVILLLLWAGPVGRNDMSQARLASLEDTVRDLSARKAPATVEPGAVAAVADRVAKLEASAVAPHPPQSDPALTTKLAEAEKRIAALADELAAQKRRSEAIASAAETARSAPQDHEVVTALNERLAALERATQTMQADVARQLSAFAQQRSARTDQRTLRLAVAAEMLKAAVARGERFRAELDAAKALAADPSALAPLDGFADTGVPTAAALAQRLGAILPAMRRAATPAAAADGGFLKRLQVNAERLVRIQPIGEQPGDDPDAILSRAEVKLGRGDIAGALAELKSLPAQVRAPADDWIKTAQARAAAIEASRQFAAAQVGALAGRSD